MTGIAKFVDRNSDRPHQRTSVCLVSLPCAVHSYLERSMKELSSRELFFFEDVLFY